jgi:hypothetical protein
VTEPDAGCEAIADDQLADGMDEADPSDCMIQQLRPYLTARLICDRSRMPISRNVRSSRSGRAAAAVLISRCLSKYVQRDTTASQHGAASSSGTIDCCERPRRHQIRSNCLALRTPRIRRLQIPLVRSYESRFESDAGGQLVRCATADKNKLG